MAVRGVLRKTSKRVCQPSAESRGFPLTGNVDRVVYATLHEPQWFRMLLWSQPKTLSTLNNFVKILQQTCYQQADIRMRSHGLRQLVDDRFVVASCQHSTDLLQVDCQNLLSTGLLQVVSTSCNKSVNDKLQQA